MTGGPYIIRRSDFPDIDLTDGRNRWPVVADSIIEETRRLAVYAEWLKMTGQTSYIEVSHDLWDSLIYLPSAPGPPPFPDPNPTPIGWPTYATTGVSTGTVLTPTAVWAVSTLVSLGLTTSEVIEGRTYTIITRRDFIATTQYLNIDVPYVCFRQCRFSATGLISNTYSLVQLGSACKTARFEYCTVDGGPFHNRGIAGDYGNIVVRFGNFTRFGNAAVEKNDRTGTFSIDVRDSYLYEPKGWPRADHADGIQMGAGKDFIVTHNTIYIEPYGNIDGDTNYVSNSCVGSWAELGNVTGTVLIATNLLAGGGSIMYVEQKGGWRYMANVSVLDNVFDRKRFPSTPRKGAIWFVLAPPGLPTSLVWGGNTYEDGTPLSLAEAIL